ncbi:MAG: hypothetical protein ACP5OO_00040 [Chloroflexia bacterium]
MPYYERILPLVGIVILGLGLILLVEGIHSLTLAIPLPRLGPAPTWQVETVESEGSVGTYSALALSRGGVPYIAYQASTAGDLRVARYDGFAWVTETVDSAGVVGAYPSIALDRAGFPRLSYYDVQGGNLRYARYDGLAWVTETVDMGGNVGMYTSLALDEDGRPNIAYYDETDGDLRYAYFDGTAWFTETVDAAGDVGRYASLALDGRGLPHIAYHDAGRGEVRYARFTGAAWLIEGVDRPGGAGAYISLVLDTQGRPHIGYYDAGRGELRYAVYDGSSWITETVLSGGAVGLYSALALDGQGRPHLACFDASHSRLLYLSYSGTSWVTQTVESGVRVGSLSLALDPGDHPHIAYGDLLHGGVRHAFIPLEERWEVDISIAWMLLFFLLLVVGVGVEFVRPEMEEEALPTGRHRRLDPVAWIGPVMLTLTAFLFLRLLAGLVERSVGLGVTGLFLLGELVALHYRYDERPRVREWSYFFLDLWLYLTAFFLFGAIYTLRLRSLFSSTTLVLLTFLLALALLRRFASLGEALLYAAGVGLAVGEVTWPLNYWAIGGLSGGAFLLVVFYVLVSLSRHHFQGKLSARLFWEYGLVLLLAIVLLALQAFGLLGGW